MLDLLVWLAQALIVLLFVCFIIAVVVAGYEFIRDRFR